MRLMHLGFNAYVIGEIATPPAKPEDLVVAVSGSGETPTIVNLGENVKEIGSHLVTITSDRDSTLGRISDIALELEKRGYATWCYEIDSIPGLSYSVPCFHKLFS
jgi:6-phospho-3-hexuloisomerase